MTDDSPRVVAFERALKAFEERDWPETIIASELALTIDPACSHLWSFLGSARVKTGDISGGIEALRRAVEIDPRRSTAMGSLGFAYLKLEDFESAHSTFSKCVEFDPRPEAMVGLGGALAGLGRSPEAIAALEKALELDPEYDEAMYNLAHEIHDERPKEAIGLLRAATEIDAEVGHYHGLLGVIQLGEGDIADGERSLRKALALDPKDSVARVRLAESLDERGEFDEAESEFSLSRRDDPDSAYPLYSHGCFHFNRGQRGEALKCFERAVEVEPSNSDACYFLGEFHYREGNLPEAKRWLLECVRLCPDDDDARTLLRRLEPDESASEDS